MYGSFANLKYMMEKLPGRLVHINFHKAALVFVYHLLQIEDWMKQVTTMYPTMAKTIQIGKSYEKRPLTVMKVTKYESNFFKGKFQRILTAVVHTEHCLIILV